MASPALRTKATHAEYLEIERSSDSRHEYYAGVIYAMAGGTPEHGILAANVIYELRRALGERPSVVTTSDVRIRVAATGLSTYPDVSVVCGPIERATDDAQAITNPALIVEVLSDGTEAYDRGEKFAHYRRLPSLSEYVLVAQHERRIEVFRRNQETGWTLFEAATGERVALKTLGGELVVDDVYRGIPLPAPALHPDRG